MELYIVYSTHTHRFVERAPQAPVAICGFIYSTTTTVTELNVNTMTTVFQPRLQPLPRLLLPLLLLCFFFCFCFVFYTILRERDLCWHPQPTRLVRVLNCYADLCAAMYKNFVYRFFDS